MAENKCAARLEPSSRDMSELKNRFKPGYDCEYMSFAPTE